MIPSLSKLHHVAIVVENIDASVKWYVEHLGFERQYTFGFPGTLVECIVRGEFRIELLQNEWAAPMAHERQELETNLGIGGINHFAIEVADLDDAVAALLEKGVEVVSPPREIPNSGGDRFAFIRDNERMLVELVQPAR